ncbi:CTP-dependent diacylglycerol kinase 1 [Candida viswanathii]|jgi:diacylglycerol kinase (CTP)|uniref:CTP-dependent diacylglycerol kinase 1 n=1 Tax=Candida viswanathii TaxID=5486 RepID=A0A367XPM3_9ASCO|nr:CTP-dependent diacylglycerol kinase 1 [Candida viswanathii]
MASAPSSPIKNTSSVVDSPVYRLRKDIKQTILDFDSNSSYIEEEDKTYIYTNSSIIDDDDDEEEEDVSADLLDGDDDDLDNTEVEVDAEEEDDDDDSSTVLEKPESESSKGVEKKPEFTQPLTFYQFLKKHEIPRKVFHSSIGVLTLWLYTLGVTVPQLFIPLGFCFAGVLINDLVRLNNPKLNEKICRFMSFMIRESEYNSYNGTLFYLAGVLIVLFLYPKDISVLSILLLSWADTSASTFGRAFGKYTPKISKGKSLAGCLASCLTGIITGYLWYGYFIPAYSYVNQPGDIYWNEQTNKMSLTVFTMAIGLIASLSEGLDFGGIDDNFTIPVISGTAVYWLVRLTQKI